MKNQQKGFTALALILLGVLIIVIVTAGIGVAGAVYGNAPQCPDKGTTARSESQIGDALSAGTVTLTNGEATTLAQKYAGSQVEEARVCFTSGLGHVSGKLKLGPVSPTFYLSGGVDLTGQVPQATNLNIKLGALPNISFVSSLAEKALNNFIRQSLANIRLNKTYSAEFADGTVTIK